MNAGKARPIAATLFVACCLLLCGLILRRQIAAHPLPSDTASAGRFGSGADRQQYEGEQGWQPASASNVKQTQAAIKGQLTALRAGDAAGAAVFQSRRLSGRFGSSTDFLRIIQARRPELVGWKSIDFGPVQTDSAGRYARSIVWLQGKAGDRTPALFLLIREGGQLKIDRLRAEQMVPQPFPNAALPPPMFRNSYHSN